MNVLEVSDADIINAAGVFTLTPIWHLGLVITSMQTRRFLILNLTLYNASFNRMGC